MKSMLIHSAIAALTLFAMSLPNIALAQSGETLDTRIGKLSFTHDFANGYPVDATQKLLFDEMDFQRACQAYIWSIPLVGFAQWQYANNIQLGAKNGQFVSVESYEDLREGLTANGHHTVCVGVHRFDRWDRGSLSYLKLKSVELP